jgi:hypothetical protein
VDLSFPFLWENSEKWVAESHGQWKTLSTLAVPAWCELHPFLDIRVAKTPLKLALGREPVAGAALIQAYGRVGSALSLEIHPRHPQCMGVGIG